jgi:hypothetical protein
MNGWMKRASMQMILRSLFAFMLLLALLLQSAAPSGASPETSDHAHHQVAAVLSEDCTQSVPQAVGSAMETCPDHQAAFHCYTSTCCFHEPLGQSCILPSGQLMPDARFTGNIALSMSWSETPNQRPPRFS